MFADIECSFGWLKFAGKLINSVDYKLPILMLNCRNSDVWYLSTNLQISQFV